MSMQDAFFVYFNSKSSINKFPSNISTDFLFSLPNEISLIGHWEISLIEFSYKLPKNTEGAFLICSDLCDVSIVNESFVPVLCQIHMIPKKNTKVHLEKPVRPKYVPLINNTISTIRMYISSYMSDISSLIQEPVSCVLHFRRQY